MKRAKELKHCPEIYTIKHEDTEIIAKDGNIDFDYLKYFSSLLKKSLTMSLSTPWQLETKEEDIGITNFIGNP